MPSTNRNKLHVVLLHALAWFIVVMIPMLIRLVYGDSDTHSLNQMYANMAAYGAMFYINYLVLTPRLFLQGHRGWYYVASVALIAVWYFVINYINEVLMHDPERARLFAEMVKKLGDMKYVPKPPFRGFGFFFYCVISLLITGFAMGLGSLNRLMQNERRQKDLEQERLNSELAFLKSQVSPHFFFNTLNNIYSLVDIDTVQAKDAVMQLSKLMRYLLYESEHPTVRLSGELDFLEHYIALMRLRLSPKVDLQVDFPREFPDRLIPPLLLVPFIENAFKHGVSHREPSYIHLRLSVSDRVIEFECRNSNFAVPDERPTGGIGLRNVQKRLDLIYPSGYRLDIHPTEREYDVKLVLEG